ncbi:methyltransferase [Parathalassolituus penaei]|uniref:Methyltransferase domain-containing protein n=1 Tax=Parathalassolituus penaei TaxID=2997323 RepID=A0A9X3EG62_9GAMM|nr:methyltransferase [Parathalassolituus penaei]MCY0966927.1 methyltransferase domain-containing protein [Parathalassolituus penaei]
MASALLRANAPIPADSDLANRSAREWKDIWLAAAELYRQANDNASPLLLEQAARLAGDDNECRYLPLLNLRARIRLRQGHIGQAWQWINRGLAIKPDSASLLYTAGLLALEQKHLADAEQYFSRSSKISRVSTRAPVYLAHVHWLQGRTVEAFEEYRELLRTRRDDLLLRSRLLMAANVISADYYLPDLAQDLQEYLQWPDIDTAQLRSLTQSLLHHQFQENSNLTVEWLADNPLLQTALRYLLLADAGLENLLTRLRASILGSCTTSLAIPQALLVLVINIGWQTRLNEGAWFESNRETGLLQSLEMLCLKLIQLDISDTNANDHQEQQRAIAAVTALFLMYRPLARSSLGEALASSRIDWLLWPETLRQRVLDELAEQQALQEQAIRIPSFAAVTDEVSCRVQAQYNQHPYPRWTDTGTWQVSSYPDTLRHHFPQALADWHPEQQHKPLQMLVAGCGTGRHALRLARYFTPLAITAVDLSHQALAWGRLQAERLQQSVNWQQGDLLEIGQLGRHFDVIECSGVLHHMDNPLAGLKALSAVLAPGGLIKIALYSRTARRRITELREQLKPLPSTDASLRKLRGHLLQDQQHWQQILSAPDFYSLSACRDLLCHEQEWLFDISAIESWLEQAGLQWVGMLAPDQHNTQPQKQQQRPGDLSPAEWAELESHKPDLFAGMYQFYARKL